MPRPKQFTVEDVLAKALRCFSTHGYHAASIADLAQAMGISRGSMYGTFDSKRGLFLGALRHHLEAESGLLQEIVGQATSVAGAIMALAARVAGDRFIVRAAVELASHDDGIEQIVGAAQREVAHLFGVLIESGQRAGGIDNAVDPVQTGRALLALCVGAGVIGTPPIDLLQQGRLLLAPPPGARE